MRVPCVVLCLKPKLAGAHRCVHHLAEQMVEESGGGGGMWQQLQQFLCKEKYQSHCTSPKQIIQGLTELLTRRTRSVS